LAYSGTHLAASTGTEAAWLIFKAHLLKAQVWSVLTCRKLSEHGRRPAQMAMEVLSETECQKEGR